MTNTTTKEIKTMTLDKLTTKNAAVIGDLTLARLAFAGKLALGERVESRKAIQKLDGPCQETEDWTPDPRGNAQSR